MGADTNRPEDSKVKEGSRYYTPSIEEFHVGFEYDSKGNINAEWVSKIVEENTMTALGASYCRVKYLDREDIESLGFKFKEYWIREEKGSIYHKGIHGITYFNGTGTISIWELLQADCEGETYFQGTIKNKSELRVLLNQLEL